MTQHSPITLPQMLMPDGQIYRWERHEEEVYDQLTLKGEIFQVVATGDRKYAVELAKQLRNAGGTHPFRSVTQLVAKSFPLSLELYNYADRMTTGGPGSTSVCQYERSLEAVVHADDRVSLRENFREWGFGWSERRPTVEVEIPRPITKQALLEAAGNFRVDATGFYERINASFPWLAT